jgi:hypothetical protein
MGSKLNRKFDSSVLVILGGWNANILLNVDWLKRYLFPENEKFKVEMPIRSTVFGPPQISTDSVKLSLIGAKLSFIQIKEDDSALREIEELGMKVADFLPHTPVNAIGINFLYETNSTDHLLEIIPSNIFERIRSIGQLKENSQTFSFSFDNHTLNLRILNKHDGVQSYDFNYNHQIKSLSDIKEIFANKSILEFKKETENRISDLIENLKDLEN